MIHMPLLQRKYLSALTIPLPTNTDLHRLNVNHPAYELTVYTICQIYINFIHECQVPFPRHVCIISKKTQPYSPSHET